MGFSSGKRHRQQPLPEHLRDCEANMKIILLLVILVLANSVIPGYAQMGSDTSAPGYDPSGPASNCDSDEVQCGDRPECIDASLVCDGYSDCLNNADEDGTLGACGGSGGSGYPGGSAILEDLALPEDLAILAIKWL